MRPARARVPDGTPWGAQALAGLIRAESRAGNRLHHDEWEARIPGLACGITVAAAGDFGVARASAEGLRARHGGLARALGFGRAAVPRQVHGVRVATIASGATAPGEEPAGAERLVVSHDVDGQVTDAAGCLLLTTAADCVPVYLMTRDARALGLLHAGWRGVAGGILARGVEALARLSADPPSSLWLHLGPAICGACYEVDRPVLEAIGLEGDRAHVDLRGLLVSQAARLGISGERITVSAHCTRCGAEGLHSHRGSGGRAGRSAAFLGLRGS